jgi:hypothetical protein
MFDLRLNIIMFRTEFFNVWTHFKIAGLYVIYLSENEARLNNKLSSPYRKENTTLHRYEDQLVNAV